MKKELSAEIAKNNHRLRAKIQAIGVLCEDVGYILRNASENAISPATKANLHQMSMEMMDVVAKSKKYNYFLQCATYKVTVNENDNEETE